MTELILRATSGGGNLCSGGLAFADSIFASSYAAANAFDGLTSDGNGSAPYPWASANTALPHFIGYRLAAPVQVMEIAIYPRINVNAYQTPKDFVIQSSDDSTTGLDGTWTDEWTVTGQTSWTYNVARVFTRP